MRPTVTRLARVLVILVLLGCLIFPAGSLNATEEQKDKYPWRDDLYGRQLHTVKVNGYAYYDEARSIIGMVNELRMSLGLHPLVYNAILEEAAMLRAAETSVLWSHMRPDGTFIFYTPPYSGENIAAGNTTPEKTFQQWVESPGHYRAMTNPNFTAIGIGAFGNALGDPPLWWAQIFSTSLGESAMTDVLSPAVYQPEVNLAPDIMKLRVSASERQTLAWGLESGEFKFMYRMVPGREIKLLPYVHYDVDDEYQVMTLLTPDMWSYEVSDPSVIELTDEGTVIGLKKGEAGVDIKLKTYPELGDSYQFQILEAEQYALNTTIRPDLAFEKAEAMRMEAEHDSEAGWSSVLERYALEICKLATLAESASPVDDYPNLKQADSILDLSANYSWLYFSNQDSEEDRIIDLPEWAKSYAVAVLDSGEERFTAAVFSSVEPDNRRLYTDDEILRYGVDVFEDRSDYILKLEVPQIDDSNLDVLRAAALKLEEANQGHAAPLIADDPYLSPDLPPYTLTTLGEDDPMALRLMIEPDRSAVQPGTVLDPAFVNFRSENPEILEITKDGFLKIKGNGEVSITAEVFDARGPEAPVTEPLQTARFTLRVDLEALRPTTTTPAPTTEAPTDQRTDEATTTDSGGETTVPTTRRVPKIGMLLIGGVLILAILAVIIFAIVRRTRDEHEDDAD